MALEDYWVDDAPQLNGDHEVHTERCVRLPKYDRRTSLGVHGDCWDALEKAKLYYLQVNGCKRCSRGCHVPLDS